LIIRAIGQLTGTVILREPDLLKEIEDAEVRRKMLADKKIDPREISLRVLYLKPETS